MKLHLSKKWLYSISAGLALAASVNDTLAQNTNLLNSFDNENSIKSFVNWWGVTTKFSWDSSLDAQNSSQSGSVRYEVPFTGASGEQFMTFFTIANRWGWDGGYMIDASPYTNFSFDIKVDPSSALAKNGTDYGGLEVGLVYKVNENGQDKWYQIMVTTWNHNPITLGASTTSWTHFNRPIDPNSVGLDKVVGFYFKMWSDGNIGGPLIFNIDNVQIEKPTVPIIVPPPTVSAKQALPGLQSIATSGNSQYGRQNIFTKNQNYSWVNRGAVSYSINIADAPTADNFQTHMFLVPTTGLPWGTGDTSIDWNAPHLVWLNIQAHGANLRYKTNQVGNDMMLNGKQGDAAYLSCPSPVGTWTLTFDNNTSITLTSPSGSTTNVSISEETAALFADPLVIHLGTQQNNLANAGLGTTFAGISTQNTADPLDEGFASPTLDSSVWGLAAEDSKGIILVPREAKMLIRWTLPSSPDSYIVAKEKLTDPWLEAGITNVALITPFRQAILTDADLGTAKTRFFALQKPTYTQLQVLVPGETAVPGTLTGKTGTPDQQNAGWGDFEITINAVDSNWHPVKGVTNMIHFTSSDPNASLPDDAPLVDSTLKVYFRFGTHGASTITATDVADKKKTGTSSAVTVQ